MSVPRSQAVTPGLVEPWPLCEMKSEASWNSVVVVPVEESLTIRDTGPAYTIPATAFPTSPCARPIVPTKVMFWSRAWIPFGPPASTVPLESTGVGGRKRWSIMGERRPSTVVIGSSQSERVRFHIPIPPWVPTRMWSPY